MGASHCELPMRTTLIIPGYRNSGEGHWQTLWENSLQGTKRVAMPNWDFPHRYSWMEALDEAIRRANDDGTAPILVAHGLGCITVAHWAAERHQHVHAALLVAPDDVERKDIYEAGLEFRPIPMFELPFTAHVVASNNDPLCSIGRARELADAWRASFTDVGSRGHIDTKAGFGSWPRGEAFLNDLR